MTKKKMCRVEPGNDEGGRNERKLFAVMPGLVPGIHAEAQREKTFGRSCGAASWIAGSSPAMTKRKMCRVEPGNDEEKDVPGRARQ
jgi:hypothetical protein